MSIETEQEPIATREKLRWLEEYYESMRHKEGLKPVAREDILVTTKRLINQFKEEIVRFESHMATQAKPE